MNNPVLKRLISGLIGILLLFYIGNQIYNANYSSVKTETAIYATGQDTIQMTGTAIRKEQMIQQTVPGVLTYLLGEGGKVAKGGVVAEVYDSAKDATQQQQVERLQREIARLQSLSNPGDTYAANPELLTQQINRQLIETLTAVRNQNYGSLTQNRDTLLYVMNERQVVVGTLKDFSARIAQLQNQLSSITVSGGGTRMGQIKAPASGFFVGVVDGYESQYDYKSVLGLSVAQLQEKKKPTPLDGNVVGKVCEEFDWYFAAVVEPDDALKLKEGNRVSIDFPFAVGKPVPATVAKVNQPDKQAAAAVVLRCSNMDAGIASVRDATVQVQTGDYSGIMVSQKSIHFEKLVKEVTQEDKTVKKIEREVPGVYVMHGNSIEFVQVVPLFHSGSYVICKELDENAPEWNDLMTKTSIRLYDEVIIEGTDLYDGKVIK
ncbi:HlyD family efflux transporter periplasmic adaptor subunit [Clostridium minihomine]|uniref:HlyD family efflux transporter periplasmic adaptor subunit n=1 Tax=Clostridium minihomine TaxID=2045012 RepID=UPI000C75EC20|nr:HlyD family efflux transporter periplasmic adaptor subunit [Clostridium minihomine]